MSTSFLNKIFVIKSLWVLAAYEILINYYIIKCTTKITNYMSMVNKTNNIFFIIFYTNGVLHDHNCHPSRIIKSVLYFTCVIILQNVTL